MHPYKMSLGQTLTKAHKAGRLAFCQWLISQPKGFVQNIFWSDEKWFMLNQHPNKQNTRYWGITNPHLMADVKNQGDSKIMAFVVIIDGRILPVIWHVDSEGKHVSVNSERYIEVIKSKVLPLFSGDQIKIYWWMQDGATAHTSKIALTYLREIFGSRLISRFCDREWPSRSPDLNCLDYSFWGMAMAEVWKYKPQTIPELCEVVENFSASLSEGFIRKMVENVLKRAEKCIQAKGGHFEHLL